jgi:hypothetical protein
VEECSEKSAYGATLRELASAPGGRSRARCVFIEELQGRLAWGRAVGHELETVLIGYGVQAVRQDVLRGARWMKTFVKNVPVEFVPTKQPFWTLEQRMARH